MDIMFYRVGGRGEMRTYLFLLSICANDGDFVLSCDLSESLGIVDLVLLEQALNAASQTGDRLLLLLLHLCDVNGDITIDLDSPFGRVVLCFVVQMRGMQESCGVQTFVRFLTRMEY